MLCLTLCTVVWSACRAPICTACARRSLPHWTACLWSHDGSFALRGSADRGRHSGPRVRASHGDEDEDCRGADCCGGSDKTTSQWNNVVARRDRHRHSLILLPLGFWLFRQFLLEGSGRGQRHSVGVVGARHLHPCVRALGIPQGGRLDVVRRHTKRFHCSVCRRMRLSFEAKGISAGTVAKSTAVDSVSVE